ncbi:beta-N-acetylhexosaminidase [Streptomyces jumonjinensis]|uniref:beta-N-acetylhexosaminidase n=1 Tax=Streptomyces jumonjinensis TaxID=1945 RepID=UPI00378FD6E5
MVTDVTLGIMPRSQNGHNPASSPSGLFNIVPLPTTARRMPGYFVFDQDVQVVIASPYTEDAAWLLHHYLGPAMGIPLPVISAVISAEESRRSVTLRIDPQEAFPEGGYALDVEPDRILLAASSPAGLLNAVQTLRQLLPPECLYPAPVSTTPLRAPCCHIEDAPRFAWRGVMLDVARHFMPVPFVLRMIDLAALHKLNRFQLHLTDDQGWRLEVPNWPKLREIAASRPATARRPGPESEDDGTPHGGFYSLQELRAIVAYAARRGVTVVPEIAMPGHMQAALAAYPQLGSGERGPVRTRWGGSPHVLAPSHLARIFLGDVLDVVTDVFPSPYIHLGGDECPREEWRRDPQARAWAAQEGLASTDGLQSWFLRTAAARLAQSGRRAVVWDQAMEDGGMPEDTVIAVWRDWADEDLMAAALAKGHDVLACPTRRTYLDHYQSELPTEPVAFPEETPLEALTDFDPAPPRTELPGAGQVLGTQAQLWTEYMPSSRHVEYMAFPRLGAFADAAWGRADDRRGHPFSHRLPDYLQRLDALSVEYRPLPGPHPWQRGGTGDRARPGRT